MSAPYVSGLAAILRGMPGSGSPANLAWAIKSTALDLGASGSDIYYGDGLIQMDAAIEIFWVPPTSVPEEKSTPTTQPDIWLVPVTQTSSPSPIPTATNSPISTFLPTQTMIPSPSEKSAEDGDLSGLFAHPTPTQMVPMGEKKHGINEYVPLCVGSLFVLAGILLFIIAEKIRSSAKYDKSVK